MNQRMIAAGAGLAALVAMGIVIPSSVIAEQFSTDVSAQWVSWQSVNDWSLDYFATPSVSGGNLVQTFPTHIPTGDPGNVDGTTPTTLLATVLDSSSSSQYGGGDFSANYTFYGGDLLGNLQNRALVAKYKINTSLFDGTAFTSSHFTGQDFDFSGNQILNPPENRVSLYIRSYDNALDSTAADEQSRWFNEAQLDRHIYPFGPDPGQRYDNVIHTMVAPFTNPELWNNWWGYGNAAGGWSGPDSTAAAQFAATLANVQQFRFQFDSGYFGVGGIGLAPGITGTFEIDAIYSVAQGDADLDGSITAADYAIVFGNLGLSGSSVQWVDGDFNGDHAVDSLDLAFTPNIPEPSVATLLLATAAAAWRRLVRRQGKLS